MTTVIDDCLLWIADTHHVMTLLDPTQNLHKLGTSLTLTEVLVHLNSCGDAGEEREH
jgi:hypothetical protein